MVNMYLVELAAHAWDLASATGQLDRLGPSLAVPALDGARAMIKPEYRDMVATGSPFGAEVPPPPDADDWERLAAFMGREPRALLDRQRSDEKRHEPFTPVGLAPIAQSHEPGAALSQRRGLEPLAHVTPRPGSAERLRAAPLKVLERLGAGGEQVPL